MSLARSAREQCRAYQMDGDFLARCRFAEHNHPPRHMRDDEWIAYSTTGQPCHSWGWIEMPAGVDRPYLDKMQAMLARLCEPFGHEPQRRRSFSHYRSGAIPDAARRFDPRQK
jgi:hypothetical protein